MFFTTTQGNRIYYQAVGEPNARPVLLIHGSTMTGAQDFCVESTLAARLAETCRVIVPDCRGHGQSDPVWRDSEESYPGGPLVYSFSAMARDLADLLIHLDVAPAVVMGHSNGGNVALYMLKEQPRATRGGVLLAAYAYIDAHLPASVPRGMNPDRVAAESPEWMHEMQQHHDLHHGPGYWRLLLRATIYETVTHPNWTAADLTHITVPVLCVQGAQDGVNVPGQHAQTLVRWLPNAELWVAENSGHSVHHELPDEFLAQMLLLIKRSQP